ncbi:MULTISPECIES: CREC-EF hand family protein [Flavobacterium]|uniref:EF-hand domain-containing protein n=1 Tax=Flavobacterium gawalongense TaxID=2594432 RepID=A0A553BL31_9FLAO|nr:hypothetical protein [Flavobacterium gawalongense]TRX00417.1 hypothetical protein FNW33_11970 [Flavobacterium gawalongense]TRX05036.1 hypothetical protein FNW12_12020 [Flavobacterium gawalongense]TRX08954.1 hypothetical protein FNW11_10445 [Flavobacterium gawalongense]TRX10059.1 hypothetical protein FNW10_10355 [Flavobacterium gawalongense]TRX26908.1 hypothetical protein FNW38_09955 [Flavobacterium gawalongense]
MKKLHIALLGISLLLLASCKDESEKPKVIYDASNKGRAITKSDSAQVKIADLPIHMEGTNYLIHPVGDLSIREKGIKTRYGSSSVNDLSFTISNYSEYEITGFLQNLKFQRMNSDSIRVLTDKPVLIQTATYLKSVADKTQNQVMVYTMVDMDTNKDGKLDTSDIKALYLSEISGDKLTKISASYQELIDWKLIESKNRLYFRTVEDTNKNGKFDKMDVVHYSYIDLSNKEWKLISYEPV